MQWTRFNVDNTDENRKKKSMIHMLPSKLQKGLVRHLYARPVSTVPVFAYLERVDDGALVICIW